MQSATLLESKNVNSAICAINFAGPFGYFDTSDIGGRFKWCVDRDYGLLRCFSNKQSR